MTSTSRKLAGCYRRVLTFLLVVIAVGLVAGLFVYRQVGGAEGARHWMAERALNGVEKHLKSKNRPDGISEDQITQVFTTVREALQQHRVNLPALYELLKSYQTTYKTKKSSTPEVQTFLVALGATVVAA